MAASKRPRARPSLSSTRWFFRSPPGHHLIGPFEDHHQVRGDPRKGLSPDRPQWRQVLQPTGRHSSIVALELLLFRCLADAPFQVRPALQATGPGLIVRTAGHRAGGADQLLHQLRGYWSVAELAHPSPPVHHRAERCGALQHDRLIAVVRVVSHRGKGIVQAFNDGASLRRRRRGTRQGSPGPCGPNRIAHDCCGPSSPTPRVRCFA